MGDPERQGGNHPLAEVSPEEAYRQLFGQDKEKEKKIEEIGRGEFMVNLAHQKEMNTNIAIQAAGMYQQAQLQILRADSLKEKIRVLDENEYKVKFFKDEDGNLAIKGSPKKKAGFKP